MFRKYKGCHTVFSAGGERRGRPTEQFLRPAILLL
uniref:Uncharacterized protein n=1 Tax=Anguilla anguilla TaxID=7936 RepID=A0A0E9RYL2_ANGAN